MASPWLRAFSFAVGAIAAALLVLAFAAGAGPTKEGMVSAEPTCATPSWERMGSDRSYLALLYALHAYDGDGSTWSIPPGGTTAQWREPGAADAAEPAVAVGPDLPAALFRKDPSGNSDKWTVGLPLAPGTTLTLPPSTAIAPVLSDMTFVWALAGTPGGEVVLLELEPASARLRVTLDGSDVSVTLAAAEGAEVTATATAAEVSFLALSRKSGRWSLRVLENDAVRTTDLPELDGQIAKDLFLSSARPRVRVDEAAAGGGLRLGFLGVFGRALPDMDLGSLAAMVGAEVQGTSANCRETQRLLEASAAEVVRVAEARERAAREAVREAAAACAAASPAGGEDVPAEWRGPGGVDLRIDPSNILGIPRAELESHAATCRAIAQERPSTAGLVVDPRVADE